MLFAFLPCAWVFEWCLDLCNSRQSLTSSPTADKESWNQQIPQHSSPKETCYEVTLFQSLWICLSRSQRKGPIWHNNTLWNNAMFRNNHKPSVAETKFHLLDKCICSDHPSDLSTATKSHSRYDQTIYHLLSIMQYSVNVCSSIALHQNIRWKIHRRHPCRWKLYKNSTEAQPQMCGPKNRRGLLLVTVTPRVFKTILLS